MSKAQTLERLKARRLTMLAQAEEMAQLGTWAWDVASDQTTWSKATYDIHGFDRDQAPPDLAGVLAIYHPEDAALLARMVDEAVREGTNYALQARIYRPDGSLRHVVARGAAERGPGGEVIGLFGTFIDVTSLKLADDEVRRSEALHRHLMENARDIFVRESPEGVILEASAGCRALGYEPEELVGVNVVSLIHRGDLETLRAAHEANRAEDPTDRDREYRVRAKDGHYVWLQGSAIPVRDADGGVREVVSIVRNINDYRLSRDALAVSETRYRLITEQITDVVACCNPEGLVTFVSPSIEALVGHRPEELVGGDSMRFIHPDDKKAVRRAVAAYVAKGPGAPSPSIEYRAVRKDGQVIWLEGHPVAIYDAVTGALLELQDCTRDISARKALEADLGAARDAAEAAAAVKSAFLANMSHEIRTPLTAILGYSDLLTAQSGLDGVGRRHLERIRAGSQALLSIVNDVLDFSKLEAQQAEIAPEPVAIAKMTEEALALFSPQAQDKGLDLTFEVDGPLPAHLMVDPHRLRQILFNLIGNAVKFTVAGEVRLKVAYAADLERLHLFVADTGPGMDAIQTARLFQRFSQVDAASTRKHGGTGLGLAICKGLAEAMGGGVSVESTPGQGSVFHVHLWAPVTDLSGPSEPELEAAPADDLKVLVVDDNDVNRELARLLLESFGAQVLEAPDGESALALVQAGPVDLILMDIRMPGLDGPSTLRRLRGQPGPNQAVPVLAFSADADLEGAPWAHEFDGLVRKPIVAAELLAAIGRCLEPPTADAQILRSVQ
ncbi:PAS domain-containing protein [Phenylobacterium sp. 20VBR1]|uniref:histidine kinase n=1 Tax=Phenylobacterium glaciei TaxID=2803784 RepID=A0A941HYF7_9CAUL|nr:PAS domain-containing hybrid sensor histidine kinase/response regulator [Phenylobacterium glaciei]MBR7621390.1 PAS domain-containing protein [Phenylobacterium glaciei]